MPSKVELKPHGSGGVVFELGDMHSGVLELRTGSGGATGARRRGLGRGRSADAQQGAVGHARQRAARTGAEHRERRGAGRDRDRQARRARHARNISRKRPAGYYDLVIYDRCQPKRCRRPTRCSSAALPPGGVWTAGAKSPAPQIIDVETAHPLMQLIDLGNVQVRRRHAAQAAARRHGADRQRRGAAVGHRPARRLRGRRAGRRDRGHRRAGRTVCQHRLAAAAELSGLRAQRAGVFRRRPRRRRHGQRRSRASRSRCAAPARPRRSTVAHARAASRSTLKREQAETLQFQRHRRVGRLSGRGAEASAQAVCRQPVRQRRKRHRAPARRSRSKSATSRWRVSPAGRAPGESCGSCCCWGHWRFVLEWYIYNRRVYSEVARQAVPGAPRAWTSVARQERR